MRTPNVAVKPKPAAPPAHLNGGATAKKPPPLAPVFELVKADPPAAVPAKQRITEMIRPLLEEILTAADHDWFRLVLFHKANQANFNIKKLRDQYSKAEWEWRAVKLVEVDQSAIYVRWVGKSSGGGLL